MLIARQIDEGANPLGKYYVIADTVDAVICDMVLVNQEGNGVRQILNNPVGCIISVIVGIVNFYPQPASGV